MTSELAASMVTWQQTGVDGTFEEAMSALEAIVGLLDSGDLTLDQSLECFEIGARLSKRCQLLMERAELRIELVRQSLETDAAAEPPF